MSPAELESVILEHPAIRDCAVIGKPDQIEGDLATAFIVLDKNKKFYEAELMQLMKGTIEVQYKYNWGTVQVQYKLQFALFYVKVSVELWFTF